MFCNIYIYFIVNIFFLFNFINGQSWYNHNELNWETIETQHFYIHYHKETERSAREAAKIAEHVYGPITNLYQFEPDSKTHIIVKDTDDYSNGAAYFYDNKIEIWALPLDFDLRGSHRWIQNVITHEFTHIIQIQASMKYNRNFPASYLQMIGYENEKREDVLYGYPNIIISTPIPNVSVPPWLAEGTAQLMYEEANFDYWDSHRDMILRDRVLHKKLLSFNDMNSFGKRGTGNESTYNQGYSFTKYIVNEYGYGVLKKINKSLSKKINFSIYKALKDATGIEAINLYNNWKSELESKYYLLKESTNTINNTNIVESDGTTNLYPVWSPNDEAFAFISNKDNDYFSQTDLFIYNLEDSLSKKIMSGVIYAPDWISDSTIVYTKRSKPNQNGSKFYDLYLYNINSEEETQLTFEKRIRSPHFIKEKNEIYAITSYDGTANIVYSSLDSINFKPLTHYDDGFQIFSLVYDNKKNKLYFDCLKNHTRDIYELDLEYNNVKEKLTNSDDRNPIIYNDKLYFSSDKSGIFNIYFNIDDMGSPVSNVFGGAFMPNISKDGKLLFSLYNNGRYSIILLDSFSYKEINLPVNNNIDKVSSLLFDKGETLKSTPYDDTMSSSFIFPRIMFDYNSFKPGFYFFIGEILDKLSVIGGASINSKLDKDLILQFEFKKFHPTLYLNFFGISRLKQNLKHQLEGYGDNVEFKSDIMFSLFEADIGMRLPIFDQKIWIEYVYQKFRQQQRQIINAPNLNIDQKFGFDYYRGHSINVKGFYSTRKPEFAGNMLPSNGYEINYELSYEKNQFMSGLDFDSGVIQSQFNPHNTGRVSINAKKHITLNQDKKIVFSTHTNIGFITNKNIDDFFHFFGGGLPGLRGYTFYDSTITGSQLLINSFYIRMPIVLEKNYKLMHLNLQNLSIGTVFQVGGGFNKLLKHWINTKRYKLSSGIEIRLSGFSFYAYPIALTYEYHIPIDDLDKTGKNYFTILFEY